MALFVHKKQKSVCEQCVVERQEITMGTFCLVERQSDLLKGKNNGFGYVLFYKFLVFKLLFDFDIFVIFLK